MGQKAHLTTSITPPSTGSFPGIQARFLLPPHFKLHLPFSKSLWCGHNAKVPMFGYLHPDKQLPKATYPAPVQSQVPHASLRPMGGGAR